VLSATLWLAVTTTAVVLGASTAAEERDPEAIEAGLSEALALHVTQPVFARAIWGVQVADLDTGVTLFATNAQTLLKPASNAKLFTAALALDRLGPDYPIPTDLILEGPMTRRGTLRGDVVVRGHGDFSAAARFHGGDHRQSLGSLVSALKEAGVRRVDGALVADASAFGARPFGASWTWEDLAYYYGAEVGALNTDDNVLDVTFQPGSQPGDPVRVSVQPETDYLVFDRHAARTVGADGERNLRLSRLPGQRSVLVQGSLPVGGESWVDAVTVPEPNLFFVYRFREELERAGIPVREPSRVQVKVREQERVRALGGSDVGRRSSGLRQQMLLRHSSPPLRALLPMMLKPSQNLYAQLLLLQVGLQEGVEASAAAPKETALERAGLQAMAAFLGKAGIDPGEVLFDEGSGLSRSALVTPQAVVSLLRHMHRHPHREVFLDALPVAGVDGTLRRRLRDTPAAGHLRAKTGTLRYVHALSGMVTHSSGRRLVFAALLNAYDPKEGAPNGREALDALALLLAGPEEGSSARVAP
jgi:D-alanyl-D-alanine carboxypeptidase/D-alanyl-D-alanine-endopeptidase (penicillin-binding protein 4)